MSRLSKFVNTKSFVIFALVFALISAAGIGTAQSTFTNSEEYQYWYEYNP